MFTTSPSPLSLWNHGVMGRRIGKVSSAKGLLLKYFGIRSYFDSSPDSLEIHSFGGLLAMVCCIDFSYLRVNWRLA